MADAIINVARLREILFYDPTSPSGLRWKVDRGYGACGAKAGQVAGCLWKDQAAAEYWKVSTLRKQYYAHRLVWMIERGPIPAGMQIDHINGDGRDNRIENLRAVSAARNSRNQHRDTRNKTGVVGVAWLGKKNAYIAYFYDFNRKLIQRQFSCRTMTKRDAFRAAVAFRMDGIAKLNAMGAGYTRAHINKSRYA